MKVAFDKDQAIEPNVDYRVLERRRSLDGGQIETVPANVRSAKLVKAALYARVSTLDKDQNPEVQLSPMREYSRSMGWTVQEYSDKVPAADLVHRVEWTRMMKDASLRKFDILLVAKLDRAFRSLIHAKTTIDMLRRYGVFFRSLGDPGMDTNTPNGELLFNLLASFAQYEKDLISQRVTAGMDYAKAHGTRSGNPIGKRPHDVTLQTICKAVVSTRKNGSINYYAAAGELRERTGIKSLGAGFVRLRLEREAAARGVLLDKLISEILQDKVQ